MKLILILLTSISVAFAGNIYSTDDSISEYISVNEVSQGKFQFALCDDSCLDLAGGNSFHYNEIAKTVKNLKTHGRLMIAANISIGAGIIGATVATGGLVGAVVGTASASSGLLMGVIGGLGGIGLGGAIGAVPGVIGTIAYAKANPLSPAKYFKLATALSESVRYSEPVYIDRSDLSELAFILEGKLKKHF